MPSQIPLIHLIVQYCNPPRADRQAEYDYCMRRNLANPAINLMHNLVEPTTTVPEEFRKHPKYVQHPLSRWMTYADAFAYASADLAGEIVCVANLDIFLDDVVSNWWIADRVVRDNHIVLCLSRTEFSPPHVTSRDPTLAKMAFATSQDAWIFESPFQPPDSDFELGTMGCDIAIAERIKRSGRLPVNSPNQFRILHYDICRGKTSANAHLVHGEERANRNQQRAEEVGQYLLPDIDQVQSVDALLQSLGASPLQKYSVVCDTLSRFIKINNRTHTTATRAGDLPRVALFNHWHNGDLYLSRGIIKDLMSRLPEKTFVATHRGAADLLGDIDGLGFDRTLLVALHEQTMSQPYLVDEPSRTVFVNTWIGQQGEDKVHGPGRGGSTIQLLREILAPGIREAFGLELGSLEDYLPEPRWERFSIGGVDEFVRQDQWKQWQKKVLICNGTIRSDQSAHFDFSPMIDRLAAAFHDVLFIPTNATGIQRGNVIHSPQIIRKAGNDLNENGYLSTFCDVIVGRSSGAYTFCLNRTNVQSARTFVAFTLRQAETALGFDDPIFSPTCRFVWSDDFREEAIYEVMRRAVAGE